MSLLFYLFTFAINFWHQKFVTADVTAMWHSWPQAAPHWDLVEHSTDCHRWSHWWVGATTTSLC